MKSCFSISECQVFRSTLGDGALLEGGLKKRGLKWSIYGTVPLLSVVDLKGSYPRGTPHIREISPFVPFGWQIENEKGLGSRNVVLVEGGD